MLDTVSEPHESQALNPPAVGPPTDRKRGRLPLVVFGAVVGLIIVAGGADYLAAKDIESTDDAQVDGNSVTMAAKVPGYVVDLDVTDNQRVKAGQLLFRIDPRDYVAARDQAKATLASAQAQADNAKANLEIAQVSAPAKLDQARAQSEEAAASQALATADFGRQTSVDRRSTTQENIDQAGTQLRSAKAVVANDEAQIRIARLVPQTLDQAKAQLAQAQAQVEQAKAQLATAELNLGYTEVRAPQDGWVTQRNVQLGSYVQAGQSVFALVAPNIWITANFKENQLGRMRVGQKVRIKVDAFHHMDLEGHVDSLQMGTGSRFSAFPAENATGNFVKIVQRLPVKIVIDRGLDPNVGLPLGLSVDPRVELK